jgi:NADH-quinone oxidoreductase subunit L
MSHETLLTLSLVVLLLPLFNFVVLVFFSRRLPRQGDWLGTSLLFVGLALSVVILYSKLTAFHDETIPATFTWVNFGNVPGFGPMKMDLGIMVDNISAIMLVVVNIVSALVHLFSIGYMQGDVRYGR